MYLNSNMFLSMLENFPNLSKCTLSEERYVVVVIVVIVVIIVVVIVIIVIA